MAAEDTLNGLNAQLASDQATLKAAQAEEQRLYNDPVYLGLMAKAHAGGTEGALTQADIDQINQYNTSIANQQAIEAKMQTAIAADQANINAFLATPAGQALGQTALVNAQTANLQTTASKKDVMIIVVAIAIVIVIGAIAYFFHKRSKRTGA